MSKTLYNVITLVSLLSLLHCAYSAAQHRSYLRLTEQPFVTLPADVLAQTLISLVALIYGASHVAGAFQHIKSDPNRDRSWDEAGSCMSFVTFEHRGKAMSPAHAVVRQRTEEVAQLPDSASFRQPSSKKLKSSRVLTITKAQAQEAFRLCLEAVRSRDHDNYQALLTMPKSCHPELAALLAFNVELALVREKITQRTADATGMYRLQFWRDAIAAIYGDSAAPIPRQNILPVLQPVAVALCSFAPRASMSLLDSLIVARQRTIGDRPFRSVADLENYGVATTGAMIRLQADTLARASSMGSLSESAIKAADQLGAAYGIMNLIRSSLPLLLKGVVLLPEDLMAIHNLTPDIVYKRKNPEALVLLVKDLVKVASVHLVASKQLLPDVPRTIRRAFAPTSSVVNYLMKNTNKFGYNLYDSRLQRRHPFLMWTLLFKNMMGRY
ncbi:hypothetical protein OSTOST_00993 [Ostertagia ostertagi]